MHVRLVLGTALAARISHCLDARHWIRAIATAREVLAVELKDESKRAVAVKELPLLQQSQCSVLADLATESSVRYDARYTHFVSK